MEQFRHRTHLDADDADFVYNLVAEEGYSHDDFLKVVHERYTATPDNPPLITAHP